MLDAIVKINGRFQSKRCTISYENRMFTVTHIGEKNGFEKEKGYRHSDIVSLLAANSLFKNESDFAELCRDRFEVFGPLFNRKQFSMDEVWEWLAFFWMFYIAYNRSTKKNKNNVWDVITIEKWLLPPLNDAKIRYPEHLGNWEIVRIAEIGEPTRQAFWIRPAPKGARGFILPNELPKGNDKEYIREWVRTKVIPRNINIILSKGLIYKSKISSDGRLEITAKPGDMLTAAILEVLEESMRSPEEREHDAIIELERELRDFRNDLVSKCRNWKNRKTALNRITKPEYEKFRDFSLALIEQQGVRSKDEMISILERRFQWFRSK